MTKKQQVSIEKFLYLLVERNSQINPGDTNYLEGYLHSFLKGLYLDPYQILEVEKNVEYLQDLIDNHVNAIEV